MHRRRSRLFALLVGAVAILVIAGPAVARTTVDPATLNPPPPDFFNADCETRGFRVLCTLAFSDDPEVEVPSGIVCDGVELLDSFVRSVVGKRYYDADGNLLVRHFRESWIGSLYNPATGKRAPYVGHDTIHHVLATPGDVLSGSYSATGPGLRVSGPDGGTVLIDTGRLVFDAGTGEALAVKGPHPIGDYFELGDASVMDRLCDALD